MSLFDFRKKTVERNEKMHVVITPRGYARYGEEAVHYFESKGISVDYNQTGLPYSYETFKKKATQADGLIVGVDNVDEELIAACPKLKVICKFGVGTDNIAVDHASKRGIHIERTLGTNTNAVAEHVMALLFADAKQLYASIDEVKSGNWKKRTGIELAGKTLSIIGFGEIGRRLAKLAVGIGMNVLAYDITDIDPDSIDENIKLTSYEESIQESDYISLHVPLTVKTKDLISFQEFEKMKTSSCLVNTARGGVVNEEALLQALKTGAIRSAAFDVFSDEPPVHNLELLEFEQFILTPHVASRTEESEKRTCNLSAKTVCDKLLGSGNEK